jgi:hypothetical protein
MESQLAVGANTISQATHNRGSSGPADTPGLEGFEYHTLVPGSAGDDDPGSLAEIVIDEIRDDNEDDTLRLGVSHGG